jgi:hypothetical protein
MEPSLVAVEEGELRLGGEAGEGGRETGQLGGVGGLAVDGFLE